MTTKIVTIDEISDRDVGYQYIQRCISQTIIDDTSLENLNKLFEHTQKMFCNICAIKQCLDYNKIIILKDLTAINDKILNLHQFV